MSSHPALHTRKASPMISSTPRRTVAVAAALVLLAQPAKPQTCTDVCDGTCGSTCCDLFATMNTACSQEVDAHVLTPWAPCSETCLESLEAILRVTAGSSCEPIWERTLTDLADYRTESFPNGQHALYEEFLAKCQDQRRDRECICATSLRLGCGIAMRTAESLRF